MCCWGKLQGISGSLADTVGAINPFRYTGYYYDTETGLYYLQSRYYDPNTGRFLNADDTDMLSDHNDLVETNLFAYCLNNPANKADDSGNIAIALPVILIGAIALTVVATAMYFYSTPEGQRSWNGLGHALSNSYTSKINSLRRSWNSLVVHANAYGRLFVGGYVAGYNVAFKYAKAGAGVSEHTKNARKSTKKRHQKGQRRKIRDKNGEKGDEKRVPRIDKKKRNRGY